MRLRNLTAAAVLTIAALAATTSVGQAAPQPDGQPSGGVEYSVEQQDKTALVTVNGGSIAVVEDNLEVRDAAGQSMARVPLSFHLDDKVYPVAAEISGNTATLTPVLDPAEATRAEPVATAAEIAAQTKAERDTAAFTKLDAQVRFGVTVGAILGAVVAATVGCVVGGAVMLPTGILTAVFGPLAGCVAGALALAPVGAIGGTLLIAAPVLVVSVIQFIATTTAPMPAN